MALESCPVRRTKICISSPAPPLTPVKYVTCTAPAKRASPSAAAPAPPPAPPHAPPHVCRCIGRAHSHSRTRPAMALELRNLQPAIELATPTLESVEVPEWAASPASLSLRGSRAYHDVFRLPNAAAWLRDWVYGATRTLDPISRKSVDGATTESTTVFRIHDSLCITPSVSNHWVLVPSSSRDGFTVGFGYVAVVHNSLDWMSAQPGLSGRFAMDNATGETFMTARRESGNLIVAWTQSITTCERVRELLEYEAPAGIGKQPEKLLLRNSFYERRNCRLCGNAATIDQLPSPCTGPTFRKHDTAKGGGIHSLPRIYRRFRGGYFGVCVKTRFHYITGSCEQLGDPRIVPVFMDIRHGAAATNRKMLTKIAKQNASLAAAIASTTTSDTPSMLSDYPASMKNASRQSSLGHSSSDSIDPSSSSIASGIKKRRRGRCIENNPSELPGATQRRRNVDVVDRDTEDYDRICRNRASARKSNAQRKERIARQEAELEFLRDKRVPELENRIQALQQEQKALKARR